ncbi:MAG: peptide-methionine (S)-S-oxide reductase [Bacteroidota bacterium]
MNRISKQVTQASQKVGFGGGCHWCTEAVFQSLNGVTEVEQGWIASKEAPLLSEAVIVHYDEKIIDLTILIEIHLRTHSATSSHSMRSKYRSAI